MSVGIRVFGAFVVLAAVIVAMMVAEPFNQPTVNPAVNREQVLRSYIYDTPLPANWHEMGPPPCIIIADGANFSAHAPCDREQREENRKNWEAAMRAREASHRQAEEFRKLWKKADAERLN